MEQLNRTEALEIKKDIKGIKKALENIASGIVPVKPTTQVVVKNGDPFFGKLHMSQEHMDALDNEFDTTCISLIGLMEECAELQQAASKYYRKYRLTDHVHCTTERAAMIEEIAHVLIDIRMICNDLDISPDAIQQEIYKKYPDGYDLMVMMADNKPYCVERKQMDNNFQDKLINAIKTLLSEAYPDYIFEEIYEDSGIHFLGEKYIRIKFLDVANQRRIWVDLSVSEKDQFKPDISLIEELIYRIDSELKKFKEGKS